jgi:hypothetical protein
LFYRFLSVERATDLLQMASHVAQRVGKGLNSQAVEYCEVKQRAFMEALATAVICDFDLDHVFARGARNEIIDSAEFPKIPPLDAARREIRDPIPYGREIPEWLEVQLAFQHSMTTKPS